MALAKKATMKNLKIKILVWGGAGTGKSIFGLSSSNPLVIDLENSTDWYSDEFDFLRVKKDEKNELTKNATILTKSIIDEILENVYPEVETLVIDPITDLLDNIETLCTHEYEKKALKGKKQVMELNALEKTKFYAFRRDKTREMLDRILNLDLNIILIARDKDNWQKVGGTVETNGKKYDGIDILEFLTDIVLNFKKDSKDNIIAEVKKVRKLNHDIPKILTENINFAKIEDYIKNKDDKESKEGKKTKEEDEKNVSK